jgi:putative DNA-invertase from lambdoid prophage Rac
MTKVACYLRCSTDVQNLETQRHIIEQFLKTKGWEGDLYEEKQSSRKTRPVKATMLQKLRDMEYDGCLVVKLDRFARSSRELILEVDELLKKGVFFLSINDSLDFSTASGRLHFQILCAFAQFERDLISQRTKESLQRIRMTKRLGRPPGSKDKQRRKKSGYFLKEAKKRKVLDERQGIFHPLEEYISSRTKQ